MIFIYTCVGSVCLLLPTYITSLIRTQREKYELSKNSQNLHYLFSSEYKKSNKNHHFYYFLIKADCQKTVCEYCGALQVCAYLFASLANNPTFVIEASIKYSLINLLEVKN